MLPFLFSWLLICWLLQVIAFRLIQGTRMSRTRLVLPLISAVITLLPIKGIPLARWIAGLNLQPSIPLLGLLASLVWKNCFQTEPWPAPARTTSWLFGTVAGALLYPLSLGLGNFDPYEWGWNFSPLFIIIALTTVLLIWKQNQFGFLLFLSILAYDLHLLESPNFWDYLVDPFYWLLSLIMLTKATLH